MAAAVWRVRMGAGFQEKGFAMQESDISVVRGVSIASIVLSVLAILGCVAVIALSAGLGAVASDPSNFDGYVEYRDELGATNGIDAQYDMTPEETSAFVSAVFGFISAFSGVGLVLCVISLIAGIVGVRNCRNPQKVGKVFGWSIAGAICSILMGRVVSCVLLIVNAVYSNRLKKAAQNPIAYAQPAYGAAAPQGYAQQPAVGYAPQQGGMASGAAQPVMPQQPTQAYAQPASAPVQPTIPQQPQASATPQQPEPPQRK